MSDYIRKCHHSSHFIFKKVSIKIETNQGRIYVQHEFGVWSCKLRRPIKNRFLLWYETMSCVRYHQKLEYTSRIIRSYIFLFYLFLRNIFAIYKSSFSRTSKRSYFRWQFKVETHMRKQRLFPYGNNHFLALCKKETTMKQWGNNDETSIQMIPENVESRKWHYSLEAWCLWLLRHRDDSRNCKSIVRFNCYKL